MKVTADKIAEKLTEYCRTGKNNFEIYYHINPDGDCIGSAYGLASVLRELGAKCAVKGEDAVPLQFADCTAGFVNDVVVNPVRAGVDCKNRSRTGKSFESLPFDFWIDHHGSDEEEARFEYTDADASSCAELVLQIAEKMDVKITKQAADFLFTGLVTDTNCFRTVATSAKSFEAAAKLAAAGADINTISRRHALLKSAKRIMLEKNLLGSMKMLCGGKLISMKLSLDALDEAGIESQSAPELDSINGLPETVETAVVTLMLREYPAENGKSRTRFSVKSSSPEISAKDIAERLGGGGHAHAAGGYLPLNPDEAEAEALKICMEYFA